MAGAAGSEKRQRSIVQVFDELRRQFGWKLDNRLGEGGFNYVFREEIDGFPRAVKISKDPVVVDEREWNALKMVRVLNGHPHLLQLLKVGKALDHVVTVWELADSTLEEALQERLAEGRGPFSAQELLAWLEEAAEGIDALNERGLYHRDIKPQNLFLLHGHVKVGDFGLLKQMGLSTVSHSGPGTVGYLPPECYDGRLVGWVDVYGLCATYVRMRTGRAPFGDSPAAAIERQKRGEYERDGLSPAEVACLDKVLQPGAGQRWGNRSAREWVRELRQELQAESRGRREQEVPARGSEAASDTDIAWAIGGVIVGAIAGASFGGAIGGVIVGAIGGADEAERARNSQTVRVSNKAVLAVLAVAGPIGAIVGAGGGIMVGAFVGTVIQGIAWAIKALRARVSRKDS